MNACVKRQMRSRLRALSLCVAPRFCDGVAPAELLPFVAPQLPEYSVATDLVVHFVELVALGNALASFEDEHERN